MSVDPVMLSVANNMFHSIANEMGSVMLLSAYSSIAREAKDTSTCLLDPEGRVVAQSIIILIMPVYEGGTLCGFTGSICHHVDIGGAAVMNAAATELFQEGLIIPPVKIKAREAFNGGLLERMIESNVRVPSVVIGDYRAQLFACLRGQELLAKMVRRYGHETVRACMRELQDYAERRMRATLARLPDGTYHGEDFCDPIRAGEPSIPIRVKVVISSDEVTVDLSESSDQVNGPINSPIASTHSAVYTFFVSMMSGDAVVNAGSYRPVKIIVRRGSICDPIFPAPVRNRMSVCYRVFSALRLAFADALPTLIPAAGHDSTTSVAFTRRQPGRYQVCQEVIGGGLGASVHGNGCDGVAQPLSNTGNTPVEVLEVEVDFLRVRSYGLSPNSGGAGKHRGGDGIRKVFEIVGTNVTFASTGDRSMHPPSGIGGGGRGRPAGFRLTQNGVERPLGVHNTMPVNDGDLVTVETAGGGGWGAA